MIDLPAQQSGGIQRGRGGFMRGANDVPWVTDPTGAITKSGPRKGLPKRVQYGSPSNRAKQIENTTNLVKWGERRVVLGIGHALADTSGYGYNLTTACFDLTKLDVDSDEYKTLADGVIIRAKDLAKAMLAADRGTHGHALTEDHDEGRDWVTRAEAGEALGLDAELQAALVAAWRQMLADTGLEILAVEASCVDDMWRLAGTLDRIARTTRPLRFARTSGEIVEVPAGTVLVLDVKTGEDRIDRGYWQGYAIQIASYAQSVPYDTEAETRGEWPWPIDQQHALIAHLDIPKALATGEAVCRLVHVDLVAGREHGGECVVQAKAWESRRDVFAATMLAVEDRQEPEGTGLVSFPSGSWLRDAQQARADTFARAELPADQPPPDEGEPSDDATFGPLQARYAALDEDAREWIKRLTTEAIDARVSFHSSGHRTQRRFEIIRALVELAANGNTDDDVRDLLAVVVGDIAHSTAVPLGALVGSLSATEAATFARFVHGDLALRFDDDGRPHLTPHAA